MSQAVRNIAAFEEGKLVEGFAVAPGTVTNNFDMIAEGRVQVHVPSLPGIDPWARLSSIGGGSGRGFFWVPQMQDEVLVAFAQNDPTSAYILGGLWSTAKRPPGSIPTDAVQKRLIKTGIAGAPGHQVEFDDVLQSVTITTSTQQKIALDPLAITITNVAGTLKIVLDNATQTVSIQAAAKLEFRAPEIALEGVSVAIKAATIDIKAGGPCTVMGLPIKLN